MVWSEQVGVSIIVPSDRQPGDGRNYIVIGEDVPSAIADHFTAALVFRNGGWNGPDPNVGSSTLTSSQDPNLFPGAFIFWAIGLSTSGIWEFVTFVIIFTSANNRAQYTTYRQTVLSVAPPTITQPGVNTPVILNIGNNPSYASYNEGSLQVFLEQVQLAVSDTQLPLNGTYFANYAAPYGPVIYRKDGTGWVSIEGAVSITSTTFAAGALIGTLPIGCRPGKRLVFAQQGLNNRLWRMDILTDGTVTYQALMASDASITAGASLTLTCGFQAEG